MTTRKELESVIATVINQHRLDGLTSRELAFAIRDKVEPLIRADERERVSIELERPAAITAHREIRATLRAQVEALPEGAERRWDGDDGLIWRSDVLDLIGGGSDD